MVLMLTSLFLAATALAFTSIGATIYRYGPGAFSLRREIAACGRVQEVRFTIQEVVIQPLPATILRPDFSRRVSHPALRAAA